MGRIPCAEKAVVAEEVQGNAVREPCLVEPFELPCTLASRPRGLELRRVGENQPVDQREPAASLVSGVGIKRVLDPRRHGGEEGVEFVGSHGSGRILGQKVEVDRQAVEDRRTSRALP